MLRLLRHSCLRRSRGETRIRVTPLQRWSKMCPVLVKHRTRTDGGSLRLAFIAPDVSSYCQLIRASHPCLNEYTLYNWRREVQDHLAYVMLRASYILRLQHAEDGANWLDSMVKARRPEIWSRRGYTLRQLQHDPKLERLRALNESTQARDAT